MIIMHINPEKKQEILQRLKKIEGQVRGLQKMVEEDRYCVDTLNQIASVESALRSVAKVLTRNHLETCVTKSLRSGKKEEADKSYEEIMKLISMHIG